jgi:hypothetical protein
MRDYSKVSGAFWTRGTGKSLRGDMETQIVALYLMTSPHANMIGVFNLPIGYIQIDTGLSFEGASKGLAKLIEGGFCSYDEVNEAVFVHEMANYQIGAALKATDNRVKDIQKQYENLPESHIKSKFYDKYSQAFCLKNISPSEAPYEAPTKPVTVTVTGAVSETGTETGTATTGENNIASPNSGDGGNGGGDDLFNSVLASKVLTALRDEVKVLDTYDKNPDFIELIALGLTVQDFLDAANSVNDDSKRRFNYVLKVAKTRHEAKMKSTPVKSKNKSDKGWVPEINVGANGRIS